MRALSKSELQLLSTNCYVKKITEKSISFTDEFIDLVLTGSSEHTRVEHFNSLLGVKFDKKYVDSSLNRWRRQKKYKEVPKKRGRHKSISKMSVEELEALVAYQKEVIKQLKKVHGLADDELYNTK